MKHRRWIPPIVAIALLASCSADEPAPGGPASASVAATVTSTAPDPADATTTSVPDGTATSSPAASPPTTLVITTPPTTTTVPVVGDPSVSSEPVGEFDRPIDLAVRPADAAFWIVEQGGRIVRFTDGTATVALDVTGRVSDGNEQGLLGLAFAPDGRHAYVNLTDRAGDTNLLEYGVTPDGRLDPSSERTVLVVDQPFGNHNAGDLAFGPDGMLYVPLGDGGSGGDPQRNGSDPSTLLGALLRIDPRPDGDRSYGIPSDNPFAGGATFAGRSGAPEVWSWGLRNPWKIAFDPVTDELWIPDVGQNEFEEINVVAPSGGEPAGRGADFGWSAFEGFARFDESVADSGRTTHPVLVYRHDDGCSISGGVPYRGTAIPGLAPAFVYSDFCTGAIWAFDPATSRGITLLEGFEQVTAVRAGPDDELYVIERSGTLHRLVPD